jgi:hypothetical protein
MQREAEGKKNLPEPCHENPNQITRNPLAIPGQQSPGQGHQPGIGRAVHF